LIPSELTLCQKPSNATELPKSNFRRVLVLVDDIALSYVSSAGENGECATLWFCGLNSFLFLSAKVHVSDFIMDIKSWLGTLQTKSIGLTRKLPRDHACFDVEL